MYQRAFSIVWLRPRSNPHATLWRAIVGAGVALTLALLRVLPAGAAPDRATPVHSAPHVQRGAATLAAELRRVMEGERRSLAALRARLALASDHRAALEIQRQVERAKIETELEMLRIQASHARREGRHATADAIEAAIRQTLEPAVPRAVTTRPKPTSARGTRAEGR